MSLTVDGQWITCDGEGCTQRVRAPVGLRSTLGQPESPAAAGWLYVTRHGHIEHYCARCKTIYLGTIARMGVNGTGISEP